jgi:hypothetical protein
LLDVVPEDPELLDVVPEPDELAEVVKFVLGGVGFGASSPQAPAS